MLKKTGLFFLLVVLSSAYMVCTANQKATDWPVLKGQYLGQKPPGIIPEIFAPGLISSKQREGCSGWDKEMKSFFFQRAINNKSIVYIVNSINSVWLEPKPIPSMENYQIGDFTITPDGKRMVFGSKKFSKETGPGRMGADIWEVRIDQIPPSTPRSFGPLINTKYHDSYPSLSSNGNVYFFSRKPGGFGDSDIYVSKFVEGRYQEPVNCGPQINTGYDEWDSYIAPDESYMVYCSTMPGGLGKDDLYISYRNDDGSWGKGKHLSGGINTRNSENRPYISPDGKYLFYASVRDRNRDIYWVDVRVLDKLKSKDL